MMDWTKRTSTRPFRHKGHKANRGKNEVETRQKQYFAKAKARSSERSLREGAITFVPDYVTQASQKWEAAQRTQPSKQATTNRLMSLFESADTISTMGRTLPLITEVQPDSWAVTGTFEDTLGCEASELEAKRQKLLKRADWFGLADLENFHMLDASHYKGFRDEDSSYAVRQDTRRYTRKYNNQRKRRHRPAQDRVTLNNNTRIRIGSQTYRWSPENNSIRTRLTARDVALESSSAKRRPNHGSLNNSATKGRRMFDVDRFSPCLDLNPGIRRSSKALHSGHCQSEDEMSQIATSDPPIIHHPQPRLATFNLATASRSDDLGDDGSMRVQAGTVGSPSSVAASDEVVWREWLRSIHSEGRKSQSQSHHPALTPPNNQPVDERFHCAEADKDGIYGKDICTAEIVAQSLTSEGSRPKSQSSKLLKEPNKICQSKNVIASQAEFSQRSPISCPNQSQPQLIPADDYEESWREFVLADMYCSESQPCKPALDSSKTMAPIEFPLDSSTSKYSTHMEELGGELVESDVERCLQSHGLLSPVGPQSGSRIINCTPPQSTSTNLITDRSLPSSSAQLTSENGISPSKASLPTCDLSPLSCTPVKFHQPRLFVGRLALTSSVAHGSTATMQDSVGKNGSSKRRKGRNLDKVDIRSLLDFSDDPIEEGS